MTNTELNQKPSIDSIPVAAPARTDFFDYLLTVTFAVALLFVFVVFDIAQRIAFLFGRRAHEIIIFGINYCLRYSLALLGTRIFVNAYPALERGKPYIIVSNHQSLFDIPILYTLFSSHRPRYIAKQELARWIPSVSFNLRHGGNAIIDRSNAKQAIAEIERVGRFIEHIASAIVIFPEGTRAKEGTLKRFRYAGLASLLQAMPNAVILPVTIDGSWRLVPWRNKPIPRGQDVHVIVGETVDRENYESLKDLIHVIESTIAANLCTLRTKDTERKT